jgi:hypothetical protein
LRGRHGPSAQTALPYLQLIFDATTFNRDDGPDQIDFDRILSRAGTITLVAPLSVREDVSDIRTQSRADQGSNNSVRSSDAGWAPMRKSLNRIVRAVPGWRYGRDRLDLSPEGDRVLDFIGCPPDWRHDGYRRAVGLINVSPPHDPRI